MSLNAWFWINLLAHLWMLTMDVVWWIVALRLTKNRVWRTLVNLFMAAQTISLLTLIVGMDWHHVPEVVLLVVIVWHHFGLLVLLPLGIPRAYRWLAGRRRRLENRSEPAPVTASAGANSVNRREFIGAYSALVPPLFTIGVSGLALAQLNSFRVRRFTLPISSLPRDLDGITIAQVSDMHVGYWTRERVLQKIVNATNSLRADLVLLTGDLIHDQLADLDHAIAVVKKMEPRHGLWLIEGNHDLFENAGEFRRRVQAAGLPLLMNDSVITDVRGHPVQLFGMSWTAGDDRQIDEAASWNMRHMMKQRQPDVFPILMAHHPHAFDAAAAAGLPLTLSGHTHGGQWMLDQQLGVGSILFRYWSGLYTRGGSRMIVSNGAGNMFPVRINAPAEIVHVTLRRA